MSDTPKPTRQGVILLLIMMIAALMSLFVFNSYLLASRMVERYAPLVAETMEIKLEVTTAQLRFVELVDGDRQESIERVRRSIARAEKAVGTILAGGVAGEMTLTVDDARLHADIKQLQDSLAALSSLLARFAEDDLAIADRHEQHLDPLFADLIQHTERVQERLQRLTSEAMDNFRRVQLFIWLVILFAVIITSTALLLHNRWRLQQLRLLARANRELENEVLLRKEAERVLERLATTDALTGLANRHAFSQQLAKEIGRAQRYPESFSLIMLDIDHFKRINDEYGHDQGDEVLTAVAERGHEVVRESDTLARWGGEEFLILLPETGIDGAQRLAERYRELLAASPCAGIDGVTASFGVTQFKPGESERTLLQRVDAALYRAKESGRNRVVVAEADDPASGDA